MKKNFVHSCKLGYFETVQDMCKTQTSAQLREGLEEASYMGHLDIVRYLSTQVPVSEKALLYAMFGNKIDIIRYLSSLVKIEDKEKITIVLKKSLLSNNYPLAVLLIEEGHVDDETMDYIRNMHKNVSFVSEYAIQKFIEECEKSYKLFLRKSVIQGLFAEKHAEIGT